MEKNKEFITYGIIFNPEKFQKLTTSTPRFYSLNKPRGGLWGSPIDSKWGWKDWCLAEGFRVSKLNSYTKWKVKSPNKIYVIDSKEDLIAVTNKYGEITSYSTFTTSIIPINFYKMKEDGWKGVYLTEKGNFECHYDFPYKDGDYVGLNAWDCESIIVWDLKEIQIIEKGRIL